MTPEQAERIAKWLGWHCPTDEEWAADYHLPTTDKNEWWLDEKGRYHNMRAFPDWLHSNDGVVAMIKKAAIKYFDPRFSIVPSDDFLEDLPKNLHKYLFLVEMTIHGNGDEETYYSAEAPTLPDALIAAVLEVIER